MDKVGTLKQLTFSIAGPDAEALEAELQDFLRHELGREGTRLERGAWEESGTRGEVMQAAQIVLAIPIASMAVLSLNDRLGMVPKIRRLLSKLRGVGGRGNQVTLASPWDSIELPGAEESGVMELIASASRHESDE